MSSIFLPKGFILLFFLSLAGAQAGAAEWDSASRADLLEEQAWQGLRPWVWQRSRCDECGLRIRVLNPELEDPRVLDFIRVIEQKRTELLKLYGSDPQEYNLLAHMAVGILGRESHFFRSGRYALKETVPDVVRVLKVLKIYVYGIKVKDKKTGEMVYAEPERNSRGPTQIKTVPKKIAEFYGVSEESLWRPDHAALATMGFLIESLAELKRRVSINKIAYVTPDNYVDHLPYIYFGSTRMLADGRVQPWRNPYIQAMKKYMTWVQLYEVDPQPFLASGRSFQMAR